MARYWSKYKFKNLTLLAIGITFAVFLSGQSWFHEFLRQLGTFGLVSAFLAGALFVSTFTVATGVIILFDLAQTLTPWEIGLIAGAGAVAGDLIIFYIVRDDVLGEITPIYKKLGGGHLSKILHTRHFRWTLPVIGALIIASPLPDELGVSLLGLSKLSTTKFIFISFVLNAIGIFLIISAATLIG